ncbi:MAG TPA: nitroreductase family protein [Flavobacteriaceae bacterium]|nr:nitroreductase family protein [Flavobacteriaceae bacterium]
MSFLSAMQNRYTTKVYDSSKKISPEKLKSLKEILRLSPSSINSQPWQFTFVSNESTKKILAEASFFNKPKILQCDTLVVFSRIDNLELFEKLISETLPEGAVNYYKQFVKPLPKENIKIWFDKQVYIALGVLLSACAEMGIDATPMEGIETVKYNEILNHKNYSTLFAVAIGYRDENDANQPKLNPKSRRPFDNIIKSI